MISLPLFDERALLSTGTIPGMQTIAGATLYLEKVGSYRRI